MRKHRLTFTVAVLTLGLVSTSGQEHFVYDTGNELLTSADVDGDGDRDFVVADKETGRFTIGFVDAGGDLSWSRALSSGMPALEDLAAAPLEAGETRAWLGFAHAASQKIDVLRVASDGIAARETHLPDRLGPSGITFTDIDSSGNGPSDLSYITAKNGAQPYGRSDAKSLTDTTFGVIHETSLIAQRLQRMNTVRTAGAIDSIVVIQRGLTDSFHRHLMDLSPDPVESTTGVGQGGDYIIGHFSKVDSPILLAYQPDESAFIADPFGEDPALTLHFDQVVDAVFLLEETNGNALLAIFPGHTRFAIYDFNGVANPVRRASFELDGSAEMSGILSGMDGFHLLHRGSDGSSIASTAFHLTPQGYVQGDTAMMPSRSGLGLGMPGQVIVYDVPPLHVDADQRVVLSRHQVAGDWTEGKAAAAGGGVNVSLATLASSVSGLKAAGSETLPNPAATPALTMINQIATDTSVFFFSQSSGSVIANLSIHPAPGSYEHAVTPSIQSTSGNVTIHYRLGPTGPWMTGAIPATVGTLIRDTTIEYFAQAAGSNARTPIYEASYFFPNGGGDSLDSDGDGVPDFVEIAQELDPVESGWDADDDGASDLEELLEGTDPTDAKDRPASHDANTLTAFDLEATPLSLSGSPLTGAIHPSQSGTLLRAYLPDGTWLGQEETTALPAAPPVATFLGLPASSPRDMIILSTPASFTVINGDDKDGPQPIGREMLALVPVPTLDARAFPTPDHLPGNADDWIAQMQRYHAELPVTRIRADITYKSTLAALLLERRLQEIALQRILGPSIGILTLTPFRNPEEAVASGTDPFLSGGQFFTDRYFVSHSDWHALYDPFPEVPFHFDTGYDLQALLHSLLSEIETPPDADTQALCDIALAIYRLSAQRGHLAPGAYRSPLEELRAYLQGFALGLSGDEAADEGYAARAPAELDYKAANRAIERLVSPTQRTLVTLNLEVPLGGIHKRPGCLTMIDVDKQIEIALYDHRLHAFELKAEVDWTTGTRFMGLGYALDSQTYQYLPCPDSAYHLIQLELVKLSQPQLTVSADYGPDLLGDAWLGFFFDGKAVDPFGDADGDGTNNLQEALDETDPTDPNSNMPSADLAPLDPEIHETGEDAFEIVWDFPEAYAEFFVVEVLRGTHPGDLVYLGDLADMGDEAFALIENDPRGFYVLRMRRR